MLQEISMEKRVILPILYHKGKKGKVYSWLVWSQGKFIRTEYGEVDGKKQRAAKEATPKNIGKSNETTAEEQAVLEAKSMWTHKLERKYRKTIEEAKTPLPLPMLAKDFFKREKYVKYGVHVQPKLDGIRALVYWDGRELVLTSRAGKLLECEHIRKEVASIRPMRDNLVLDGELYIHGETFQNITSLVKRPREESQALKFHVYDIISKGNERDLGAPWEERHDMLRYFFEGEHFEHLVKVPTYHAYDTKRVLDLQGYFLTQGYEGAIVRQRHGKYLFGYRSDDLLKVKNFQDDEFEVVGWTLGKGKMADVPIWRCKTHAGKEFDVVSKGTMEHRRSLFEVADSYMGKWLKVKYFELTDEGVPRFPVGLGLRMEEDM